MSALATMNKLVFRKNFSYVAFVVVGAVACDVIYGGVTDMVWDNMNRGRLFHQVDWSKFKGEDDDDEDDE
jgi:hypothetical protein